jgi:small subunit ribosomal protein S8
MSMTDPIADFLTRIRNGLMAKHAAVDVPSSALKVEIAKILQQEGFIEGYKIVESAPRNLLRIALRYGGDGERVITGLERVSRPGRRVYCSKEDIPTVLGGLGIAILSTSRGVVSGHEGKRLGVGGEVLCTVW